MASLSDNSRVSLSVNIQSNIFIMSTQIFEPTSGEIALELLSTNELKLL